MQAKDIWEHMHLFTGNCWRHVINYRRGGCKHTVNCCRRERAHQIRLLRPHQRHTALNPGTTRSHFCYPLLPLSIDKGSLGCTSVSSVLCLDVNSRPGGRLSLMNHRQGRIIDIAGLTTGIQSLGKSVERGSKQRADHRAHPVDPVIGHEAHDDRRTKRSGGVETAAGISDTRRYRVSTTIPNAGGDRKRLILVRR